MKPTKIRKYCADCGKMKAVFDSESAAQRFIDYNAEQIAAAGGHAPKRAYYCDWCGGWHVTSCEHWHGKSLARKSIELDIKLNQERNRKRNQRQQIKPFKTAYEVKQEKLKNLPSNLRSIYEMLLASIAAIKDGNEVAARKQLEKGPAYFEAVTGLKGSRGRRRSLQAYYNTITGLLDNTEVNTTESIEAVEEKLKAYVARNHTKFGYSWAEVGLPEPEHCYQVDELVQNARDCVTKGDVTEAKRRVIQAIGMVQHITAESTQQKYAGMILALANEYPILTA